MIRNYLPSSLVRSAGIYTVSRLINALLPFLLMPVLTRHLSPEEFGTATMFTVLSGIALPFIGLSLHGAISVKYFDSKETNLPQYIGNCFILLATSTSIMMLIVALLSDYISKLTSFPSKWLYLVILFSAAQFICLVVMTLWQVEDRPIKYGVFQNSQTALNFILSLLFVIVLGMSWQGRVEAQVFSMCLFAMIAFYILLHSKKIQFKFDKPSIDHALKFGLPLIPHAIGGMLIVQTDRLFLSNMEGLSVVGIYTIGYQFGFIIDLVASSFNQAFSPWLYSKLSNNDLSTKKQIVKLTYLYFVLILLLAILLSAVAPWFLTYFVGSRFVAAGQFIFWIALGYAFNGMYYMVTNYIFYAGKTSVLAWVTFSTALLNIIFNYIFIKLNGPIGSAQATALAFLTSFVFTWLLSAKVYSMPWNVFGKSNESQ